MIRYFYYFITDIVFFFYVNKTITTNRIIINYYDWCCFINFFANFADVHLIINKYLSYMPKDILKYIK